MTGDEIERLDADLERANTADQLVVEDTVGTRYTITRTRVVGAATSDPTLIIHVAAGSPESLF